MNRHPLGLYLHVPFCAGKCPYCDFYSLPPTPELMDRYQKRMEELLLLWGRRLGRAVSTVYFGGGTPSLLGAERLSRLLEAVAKGFGLLPGAEITCEVNPGSVDRRFWGELWAGGFNRISLGMQSALPEELQLLGRRHTPEDTARAVEWARAAGFGNLSLDLMLALPGSSPETLGRSIAFAAGLEPEHISAYLLKIEPGTPFARRSLALPDEDWAAEQYLFAVAELEGRGYPQYEISNFARLGRESRHNLFYWLREDYLGLGPGAHSFYGGRRFFWPRDLEGFLRGGGPQPEGEPLSSKEALEEFAMLRLRLCQGLTLEDCRKLGPEGESLFRRLSANARRCPGSCFRENSFRRVALSPEGFLVSNALLARLLDE